ncbi:KAP family P-loop NTPase fold protein [Mycobacterium yunnanensis]|uniref:KAP family P-loop NTPase fold protein n=1 Tax=Mycobacterium yunnanensis TaxID=368477 RepID=UPI0035581B7A
MTIGVLGDWGSGKSSLMLIAAAELAAERRADTGEHSADDDEDEDEEASPYLCVPFSPWQYEDLDDVKVALMNTVLNAFERRFPATAEEVGRLRAFVGTIKRLARRAGRLGATVVPTAAPYAMQALAPDTDLDTLNLVGETAKAFAAPIKDGLAEPVATASADPEPPITDVTQFRKSFAALISEQTSIDAVVVFVDDLDRCLPETVVDTLEAIRLFLNTPKTAYVLALNQAVVESAIDARYPDLKREDGAGLGRDYLEKMLQLKVAIPPLSAPEAETYANLLIAELHLDDDRFDDVVVAADENRRVNGLAVAFNAGIAGDVLENIPPAMAADLGWAANIMPVLGTSLRGNPRQLKRFMNNLLLKHRSAARRNVDLKLPELAKMMVLEDQHNSDFQKLFDWQVPADGPSPELIAAETYARTPPEDPEASGGETDPPPMPRRTTGPRPGTRTDTDVASTPDGAELDTEVRAWADKPYIGEWLRLDPPLTSVDLRPYFTYSRDKLSFGVSASRLAPRLQILLTHVQSEVEQARRNHYPTVAALDPTERAQFFEALLDRVTRNPSGIALTAAIELSQLNADLVDALGDTLLRIAPASIPVTAGGLVVRRLPVDHPKIQRVLDRWQSAGGGLRGIVQAALRAREAQQRKGAGSGNFR